MPKFLQTEFILHSAIEGQSEDYKVFDMVVLRAGPGKHRVYLEELGQFFTEFFPNEILTQLQEALEGTPIEAYRVAGTNMGDDDGLSHPSPQVAEITPEGLVLHGVGIWEDTRIAPHPEGGQALWSKGVMNGTQAAQDVRETVRLTLERGSQFVPAPSINGFMLWEPIIDPDGIPYLMARKLVNLRSTEFVNRPAAGGRLYAVVEGNRMNLLKMLKAYCTAHDIAFSAEAKTVAELFASLDGEQEGVLKEVSGLYENDEPGALTALSKAFELPQTEATPKQEATSAEPVTLSDPGGDPIELAPDVHVEDLLGAASLDAGGDSSDLSGITEVLGRVTEGLRTMAGSVNKNAGSMNALINKVKGLDTGLKAVNDYVKAQQSRDNKSMLLSYVQESELPKHRKNFWHAQVESGKIQKLDILKSFMDDDNQAESGFQAQMLEGLDAAELPVSVRNLFSVTAPVEDKSYIRAKMLFGAPLTEGEQSMVNAAGLQAFRGVKDMYGTLVPGDLENGTLTGMAYGGPGGSNPRGYLNWKNNLIAMQSMQAVTGGSEVVRRGDFTGILLDVTRQLAMARWDMQQLDPFELCHVGPAFEDFEASNLVITGAAPDMSRWNNVSGFPNIETGQRKKVETEADVLGGILRWSWDVILNDRNGSALNLIQTDVNNAIDATYRTIVRAIVDAFMGWTTAINLYEPDSDGVLYQVPSSSGGGAIRRNYVNADGRTYASLVGLLDLMQSQVDIVKTGETPQPLIMLPGAVLCVATFAADAAQMFTADYKPTVTGTNRLGLGTPPKIVGVHRSFLHNRDDFVAMIPNPMMQGVVELQYFMGRTKPSIVWQTSPEIGRTFENGEIAARLDMPVRVTMARPKGTFAAFETA